MIVAKHLTATAHHKLYTVDVGNIDCIPRLITFGLGLPTSRNLHQDDVLKIEVIYVSRFSLCGALWICRCSKLHPMSISIAKYWTLHQANVSETLPFTRFTTVTKTNMHVCICSLEDVQFSHLRSPHSPVHADFTNRRPLGRFIAFRVELRCGCPISKR